MKKNPARSEGARYERKAIREYLRRKIKNYSDKGAPVQYQIVLDWVLERQERYDKKTGGL